MTVLPQPCPCASWPSTRHAGSCALERGRHSAKRRSTTDRRQTIRRIVVVPGPNSAAHGQPHLDSRFLAPSKSKSRGRRFFFRAAPVHAAEACFAAAFREREKEKESTTSACLADLTRVSLSRSKSTERRSLNGNRHLPVHETTADDTLCDAVDRP